MPVQLVRQPDAESLARHAARDLVVSIQDAREARGAAHVCLAGGTSPPPQRITLTLPKLNASRRIVLMVTGEGKSEALARVMAGPDRTYPASLLDRAKLLVMADNAALPA